MYYWDLLYLRLDSIIIFKLFRVPRKSRINGSRMWGIVETHHATQLVSSSISARWSQLGPINAPDIRYIEFSFD